MSDYAISTNHIAIVNISDFDSNKRNQVQTEVREKL
jgi:hypothetical protein